MCEMCGGKTADAVRRDMLARIAKYDYTMVSVREERARDGSWVAPGFVYSVGLWSFHRVPEVIVVGAPARHAVELVQRYAGMVKQGKRFGPGGPYPGFVADGTVMMELVAPGFYAEWFASAFDFYPTGDFPAVQLLWADREQVWPWEPRWARRNTPQPVLTRSGRPESWRVAA
jgi:hypothetical protein